MHLATLHLAPVLGAEKSRVPFYIAGGVLVAWAFVVSVGIGLRRPDFPGGQEGERVVIAVSVLLVLATVSTAVLTSSPPAKTASAAQSPTQSAPGGSSPTAPATAPASTPASPAQPKATTGTPAPPSSPAPNAASAALELAANPGGQLSYNTTQLSARAGNVTITMTNSSPLEHNVTVASGSTVLGATPTFLGGTRTLRLTLKPGTYTFYCSVPGHRAAGMEGTLSVS